MHPRDWRWAIISDRSPLSKTARLVALAMSVRMDEQGRWQYAMSVLAAMAGMRSSTARKAVRELEQAGCLWTRHVGHPPRHEPNRYEARRPPWFPRGTERREKNVAAF